MRSINIGQGRRSFVLDTGDTVRGMVLGRGDVADPATDLWITPKGPRYSQAPVERRDTPWLGDGQTLGLYHAECWSSQCGEYYALRICDTGDVVLRVLPQHDVDSTGLPICYTVERVEGSLR